MTAAAPALDIVAATVRYGAATALHAVSLAVAANSVVALIGPNGAGKSTLLKAAMGLVPLAGGAVRFAGEDVTAWAPEARARAGMAYVPEGRRVFPGLTARENLEVACFADTAERRQRLDRVLALFPALAETLGRRAWQLSGGQQQMLAIGRALMGAPRLLLLDEPSLGLAPVIVDQLFARIAALAADGTAVLVAEQNAAAALPVAHRALVLNDGRIIAEDSAAAIAARGDVIASGLA